MVTVRSYQNPGEADFARSLLEAADIPVVLEHEASVLLSPVGAGTARLQVPPERLAEAQQILAAHPVHFSAVPDNVPRFGFWRGSICGLLVGAVIVLVPRFFGYHMPLPLGIVAVAWWFGLIFGLNHKIPQKT
jgi:hypothetical protein